MTSTSAASGGTLLYDADCGFCTTCAAWLQRHGTCTVTPWQGFDLAAVGLTAEQATAEVQWLDQDGRSGFSGAGAIAEAAKTCGGIYQLLGRGLYARPVRPVADLAYRIVARNRHRLPGSTDACRME